MDYMTITDVAKVIAKAGNWNPDTFDRTHRSIRNFIAKGLLPATSIKKLDARDSVGLNPSEVYRIRLFLAFGAVGFENDDLRLLDEAIDPKPDRVEVTKNAVGEQLTTPIWDDAERAERRLSNVVEATRAGEDWELRCSVMRDSGGNRCISGFMCRKDSGGLDNGSLETVRKFRQYQNITVEAEVVIPVSALFRPLLDV